MEKNIKKRNINIDLIKCIAVFSVISVHFFLNSGFYNQPVNNFYMIVLSVFRTLFTICVPLFLMVTGYLMKNKELNKSYYFGVIKTVFIYLVITAMVLLYKKNYVGDSIGIKLFLKQILSFDVGYCWYIEMYLGLFMIAPFLNILYNNISSRRMKQYLILTIMCLTTIPVFVNSFFVLLPKWWTSLYPISYYFIGCYLREYKINISAIKSLFFVLGFLILGSAYAIIRSYGGLLIRGDNWNNIFTFGMSISLFILIINLNMEKIKVFFQKIIIKISELSLGIYLSSYIADNFFYKHVFSGELFRIKYYFIIVPIVFITAMIISYLVSNLYNILDKIVIVKIKNKIIGNGNSV